MLLNKRKLSLLFVFCLSLFMVCAQTSNSLVERYLVKASDAYDNGQLVEAYKQINLCLKISGEDVDPSVQMIARTIYTKRLERIKKNYSEQDFIDIKTNLNEYPSLANATMKKLVQQIEAQVVAEEKAEERKNQQEFYETIQKSTESTSEAVDKMLQQTEASQKRQEERDIRNDRKFTTILIIVVVIIVVIMLVVGLILLIMHLSVKQSRVQQQQYAEAFKLLAQNQSQTNRLMLGGITDLYGGDGLKSAGSSRWGVDALPEPEQTQKKKKKCVNLLLSVKI